MATAQSKDSANKAGVAAVLNQVVCESYVLFVKTQGFHWNVTGPNFYSLHKMFEDQYNDLFEAVDTLAERIRALESFAPGSLQTLIKNSQLKDQDKVPSAQDMLKELAADHELIKKTIKQGINAAEEVGDDATADLLTARLEKHGEAAWMLRSSI